MASLSSCDHQANCLARYAFNFNDCRAGQRKTDKGNSHTFGGNETNFSVNKCKFSGDCWSAHFQEPLRRKKNLWEPCAIFWKPENFIMNPLLQKSALPTGRKVESGTSGIIKEGALPDKTFPCNSLNCLTAKGRIFSSWTRFSFSMNKTWLFLTCHKFGKVLENIMNHHGTGQANTGKVWWSIITDKWPITMWK